MSETAPQTHLALAGETGRTCDNCGTPFKLKRGWGRFCKNKCRNDFHAMEARKEAIRQAALEMFHALRLIAGESCESSTAGPGSCWSDPARTRDAKFTAERWCDRCIARAAILDLKAP